MRSENEMLQLLQTVFMKDDRIRAVWLEGSRCNPNAPRDIFQDFDIECVVEETISFQEDKFWINQFGQILYMQFPENPVFPECDLDNNYGWLIQFTDGIRLDLHVCTLPFAKALLKNEKMYQVLLDKDNCLPRLDKEDLSDRDYWIKEPTENLFQVTCNNFWWCLNNVAKGIWREDYPYVMDMINNGVRNQLRSVLEWKIGYENGFLLSTGKSGKYMRNWLSKETWDKYLATYCGCKIDDLKEALIIMCDLMDETAGQVAKITGYRYNLEEAKASRGYLFHVMELPKDAKEIYF